MTISFFCTTTSESPIGRISKSIVWLKRPFLVFNLQYSKYAHQDKSQWTVHFSCVRASISTPTQIWYPGLATWKCICLYSSSSFKTQPFHADFQKLVYVVFMTVSVATAANLLSFIFSLTIFWPCWFPAVINWVFVWWFLWLLTNRINHLMSVSWGHVQPFITELFTP